uniref:Carbonic anhydrase n=1 Tax=Dunaliella tertiolecta TaxID=3047 RepID=A0A6S8L4K1_DUNTE|mmetsp:Transcript_15002/g.40462  ORF Transcript_15002/g.40462 Transcript_15002/m.40462 type:complete len:457 (-) Transcript_15002:506-1876(-)
MASRRVCLLGALFAVLSVAIEGHSASSEASVASTARRQLKAQPHEYNYIRHGADWTGLGQCGGNAQSPIDIVTTELVDPSEEGVERGVSGASFNDLPTATLTDVKVNLEQDMKFSFAVPSDISLPTITIGEVEHKFTPLQVHFHHFASEHTVDGMEYPLEAHVVMQSDQDENQLAVLGILYKYGEEDPFLKKLTDAALTAINQGDASYGSKEVPLDVTINVREDLLPSKSLDYYGYDGSLTTPSCDEIVKWHVFTTPRTLSVEQEKVFNDATLKAHADAYTTNNRIIQPKNGRSVYIYNSPRSTIRATYGIAFSTGSTAASAFGKFQAGTRLGCSNCDSFTSEERDFILGVQNRAMQGTNALAAVISDIVIQGKRRSLLQQTIADLTITYTFDSSANADPEGAVRRLSNDVLKDSTNGLADVDLKTTEDLTPGGASSIRVGLGLLMALVMSLVLTL